MRTLVLPAAFSMAALVSSCTPNPTTSARTLLEEQCAQQSRGYLKLTNFMKHDAVSEKRDGVDYYRVAYSIEAEALKDGGYLNICESHGKYGALMSFQVSEAPSHGDCFVFPAEKGHRYQFDETGFPASPMNHQMTLAKHEQGWVIDSASGGLVQTTTGAKINGGPVENTEIQPLAKHQPPTDTTLSSFSAMPQFVVGCSSEFSESRRAFEAKRYLYVDNLDTQCQIVVNGTPRVLKKVSLSQRRIPWNMAMGNTPCTSRLMQAVRPAMGRLSGVFSCSDTAMSLILDPFTASVVVMSRLWLPDCLRE